MSCRFSTSMWGSVCLSARQREPESGTPVNRLPTVFYPIRPFCEYRAHSRNFSPGPAAEAGKVNGVRHPGDIPLTKYGRFRKNRLPGRCCHRVSIKRRPLLGLPREKIIGCQIDDFAEPGFKPEVPELWQSFLERGEHSGTLRLMSPDGNPRDVEYVAKGNVLPVRHRLVLRDKTAHAKPGQATAPLWVRDYALYLLSGLASPEPLSTP